MDKKSKISNYTSKLKIRSIVDIYALNKYKSKNHCFYYFCKFLIHFNNQYIFIKDIDYYKEKFCSIAEHCYYDSDAYASFHSTAYYSLSSGKGRKISDYE